MSNTIEIAITVNQMDSNLQVDKTETLLEILRDRLDLTGAKLGCGYGKCGSCTVILNNKAVKSCLVKADKLNNSKITTIEGISHNGKLHPIQEAFIEANAVQCGFCTTGIIMTLYALFQQNPKPSDEEIKTALAGHLCRCTGYEPILEAAKLAREKLLAVSL